MPKKRPAEERFYEKTVKLENGCLLWTASLTKDGYGSFNSGGGKIVLAHRWAYEAKKGPVPDGLEIDHLCKNPACVNHDHLEAVSHKENVRRGDARKNFLAYRKAQTHCKRGHEFTPENTQLHKRGDVFSRECKTCNKQRRKK